MAARSRLTALGGDALQVAMCAVARAAPPAGGTGGERRSAGYSTNSMRAMGAPSPFLGPSFRIRV